MPPLVPLHVSSICHPWFAHVSSMVHPWFIHVPPACFSHASSSFPRDRLGGSLASRPCNAPLPPPEEIGLQTLMSAKCITLSAIIYRLFTGSAWGFGWVQPCGTTPPTKDTCLDHGAHHKKKRLHTMVNTIGLAPPNSIGCAQRGRFGYSAVFSLGKQHSRPQNAYTYHGAHFPPPRENRA